jgi:hypothetical protein
MAQTYCIKIEHYLFLTHTLFILFYLTFVSTKLNYMTTNKLNRR